MLSIKKLYKIGPGPSSSHTMGPKNAVEYILNTYPQVDYVEMVFYGSLAETGRGHLSDYIAEKTFKDVPHKIIFDYDTKTKHPNTMVFTLYKNNEIFKKVTILSIGGGLIKVLNQKNIKEEDTYPHKTFDQIKKYCIENSLTLIEYIYRFEKEDINEYIENIYRVMMNSIESGLSKEGVLPGKLKVRRKAKELYEYHIENESEDFKEKRLISAYAFAVSEENASGELIVTAPTCGASGVIPSLVKYSEDRGYAHQTIIEGLLIAGLIGLIVKENASISGAECGCQAEVGTATSMGAAFLAYLDGQNIYGIERASEIAMEHSLGLTCDPIDGYVQIPCIERNAVGALRSIATNSLSILMGTTNSKISFDIVVKTMYKTGKDLNRSYKETSKGGLAKTYEKDNG